MPFPYDLRVLLEEIPREYFLGIILLLPLLNLTSPVSSSPPKRWNATLSRQPFPSQKQYIIVLHHFLHSLFHIDLHWQILVLDAYLFSGLSSKNFMGLVRLRNSLSVSLSMAYSYYFLNVSIFWLVYLMSVREVFTPRKVYSILLWV